MSGGACVVYFQCFRGVLTGFVFEFMRDFRGQSVGDAGLRRLLLVAAGALVVVRHGRFVLLYAIRFTWRGFCFVSFCL